MAHAGASPVTWFTPYKVIKESEENTMKKETQEQINNEVLHALSLASIEYGSTFCLNWKRLRSCSAWVTETQNYYFLRSYNTMVAFIDKRNNTCYDVLRYVFGFTNTSASHIAKFRHDYYCVKQLTYRY